MSVFLVGALLALSLVVFSQGVIIVFLVRRLRRARAASEEVRPQYSCNGCGKPFATEWEAIAHAEAEHNAPPGDDEAARYIITEIDP